MLSIAIWKSWSHHSKHKVHLLVWHFQTVWSFNNWTCIQAISRHLWQIWLLLLTTYSRTVGKSENLRGAERNRYVQGHWKKRLCFSKPRQPIGQRLSNVRVQQKRFQLGQSYSYIMRKVWYHQIWIQNNLSFMVLILM
jgi:hypothetical protein